MDPSEIDKAFLGVSLIASFREVRVNSGKRDATVCFIRGQCGGECVGDL